MMNARSGSLLILWLAAPFLLWLSLYRPFTASSGRAERLPRQFAGFVMSDELHLGDTEFRLLGTDDAVWRSYRAEDGGEVRVVAVFHQQNWKSVHPPHICLRGSDMTITEDDSVNVPMAPNDLQVGRLIARSNRFDETYLNLYLFGAPGFRSASYLEFFLHHAPMALVRESVGGFLLRVEVLIDPENPGMSEARARKMLTEILPYAEQLVAETADQR